MPHPLARAGLLIGVVACVALLLQAAQTHYIIRALTDTRYRRPPNNLELLRRAANALPDSVRLQLELGETELTAGPNPQRAQQLAEAAVQLSPADYRGWHLLGLAHDAAGAQSEAEQAFAQAIKLAPTNSQVNWAAANVFLRGGLPQAALAALRTATAGDETLLPTAFDLLWQTAGQDSTALKSLAAERPNAQLALAQFFVRRAQFAEAVATVRQFTQAVPAQEWLADARQTALISQLITQLVSAKQFTTARALWLEALTPASARNTQNLLWNGGFELEKRAQFEQFDWKLNQNEQARVSLDSRQPRSGRQALKITFTGRDTTTLNGEIEQLLALRPGATYQLTAFVKTAELVTPGGPQIAVWQAGNVLAVSAPVPAGTSDWQPLTLDFTAPPNDAAVFLRIVRRPQFVYDEPTSGLVWFDDFQLRCISGC